MLGDLGSASNATATAIEPFNEAGVGGDGGVGSNSGEDMEEKSSYGRGGGGGGGEEFGERSFGGNRWPPQETLALLKIRSDMDVAFRDASVKGPLWDEVSRKLAELGYHRGTKKCKEKFENVYKYHRRTKEGRTGKSDGKTYRFFDQLRALENQPPATTPMTTPNFTTTTAMATLSNPQVNSTTSTTTYPSPHQGIATTLPTIPTSIFVNTSPIVFSSPPPLQPPPPQQDTTFSPPSFPSLSSTDLMSNLTSSSTSSDDEMEGRAKRKRKLKDLFDTLMKEVVKKQEDLQRRFLEAVENREKERMAREEAWRMQEMNHIHREREILAQERSVAAAKDVAVMSFLQNLAEQQQQQKGPTSLPGNYFTTSVTPSTQQDITPPPPPPPPLQKQMEKQIPSPIMSFEITPRPNNGDEIIIHNNDNNNGVASPISTTTNTKPTTMSSSRWPKAEVHSLIKIRTSLDSKYQENGAPKGPLWEEISTGMKRLGYNRNPKRCKEKWENINKYFKKVKESNKKRPEDSKTCPYFHLLDSLYRERNNNNNFDALANAAAPMMVRPEQQWQPPPPRVEGEMEHNPNEDEGEEDEGEDEDEEDEGSYEMVANKASVNPVSAE